MKKWLVLLIILGLVGVIVVILGLPRRLAGRTVQAPATATATPLPPAKAASQVVADAKVVPVRSAELSLPVSGIVAEILVKEGDFVKADQPLLRLNAARQRANLAQVEAQLSRAKARYEQTIAGSREQEISAAVASVDAAKAQLQKLKQGSSTAEIESAQAALAAAQAELRRVQAGPDSQQLIAAKAELDNADAKRRQAQAAYDRVRGSPDIGRLPESLALEQATNEYNAALARYQALQKGANPADVAAARARVNQAQADLNRILAPANASDIAAAEAEVRRAQAQLDLLLAGPRAEEIAAVLADVQAAEAAVEEAQAAVAETELTAPFDGEIVSLDVILGQQVATGQPIVRMADFSEWRIETNDLTELDVVGILPGDPVSVSFDAIPGLELPGHVLRIKPIGENRQGDVTYTVIVGLDRNDDRLLWNMTSTVRIDRGAGVAEGARAVAQASQATAAPTATWTPTAVAPTAVITATAPLTAVNSQSAVAPLAATEAISRTGVLNETAVLATPEPGTVAPNATPSPTATAQPPTATPTTQAAAPVPTATRVSVPPRPTLPRPPTSRPTAAPVRVVASPPELVQPQPRATVTGDVLFEWRPTGPLPVNSAYEVVWWNVGENPGVARGIAPPTLQTSLTTNLDVLYETNQFTSSDVYWTVLVVKTDPYVRVTQPAQSNIGLITYQPSSPPKPRD